MLEPSSWVRVYTPYYYTLHKYTMQRQLEMKTFANSLSHIHSNFCCCFVSKFTTISWLRSIAMRQQKSSSLQREKPFVPSSDLFTYVVIVVAVVATCFLRPISNASVLLCHVKSIHNRFKITLRKVISSSNNICLLWS